VIVGGSVNMLIEGMSELNDCRREGVFAGVLGWRK